MGQSEPCPHGLLRCASEACGHCIYQTRCRIPDEKPKGPVPSSRGAWALTSASGWQWGLTGVLHPWLLPTWWPHKVRFVLRISFSHFSRAPQPGHPERMSGLRVVGWPGRMGGSEQQVGDGGGG